MQSGGPLGLTAPAKRAGGNCSQEVLCTGSSGVLVVPIPGARGPLDNHAFVTLQLDYAFYMGLPLKTTQKLQLVQNAVA